MEELIMEIWRAAVDAENTTKIVEAFSLPG